jgi:hypothetical protein
VPTPPTPQEPSTPPTAETPEPTPTPATEGAQSASAEEDTIKAQIESFVNQNNQTAPGADEAEEEPKPEEPKSEAPSNNDFMADAIKGLVTDEGDKPQSTVGEKVVQPPSEAENNTPPAPAADAAAPAAPADSTGEPTETDEGNEDDGGVTHKKIIAPITSEENAPKPDLNALLAKEGLGSMDDMHQGYGAPTPQNPTGLPTAPHPPGHVISPNPQGQGGVDPNSIAL